MIGSAFYNAFHRQIDFATRKHSAVVMRKIFSTEGISVKSFKFQKGTLKLIASYGSSNHVYIFDRHGTNKGSVDVQGKVVDADWDRKGDKLAIIDDQLHFVYIWDSHSSKTAQIPTHFKENLSALSWSKVDERLAVGTNKGNFLIYDWKTTKKYPVLGVHTRRISCVIWGFSDLLISVGDDKSLALISYDGDLINRFTVEDSVKDVKINRTSITSFGYNEENVISCIVGNRQLLIWKFHEDTQPIPITFKDSLGDAVSHEWQNMENIIVGFSRGSIGLFNISSDVSVQELTVIGQLNEQLTSIAVSHKLQRLASASPKRVIVHELDNLNEPLTIIEIDGGNSDTNCTTWDETDEYLNKPSSIGWSEDGQMMGVVSHGGILHVFLNQLPSLVCISSRGIMARLSSLQEITIEPLHAETESCMFGPKTVPIEIEPTLIGLGPNHLVVGTDRTAFVYDLHNFDDISLISEHTYPKTIQDIKLNDEYAAALTAEGELILHLIVPSNISSSHDGFVSGEMRSNVITQIVSMSHDMANSLRHLSDKVTKIFPENGERIVAYDLAGPILSYTTEFGKIYQFHTGEWSMTNEYEHLCQISSLFSENSGLLVAFIDVESNAYVFCSAFSTLIEIPHSPVAAERILWNSVAHGYPLLAVVSENFVATYCCFTECITDMKKSAPEMLQEMQPTCKKSAVQEGDKLAIAESAYNRNFLEGEKRGFPLSSFFSTRKAICSECRNLDSLPLLPNQTLIGFCTTDLCFLSPNGALVRTALPSQTFRPYTKALLRKAKAAIGLTTEPTMADSQPTGKNESLLVDFFGKALECGAFHEALQISDLIRLPPRWLELARASLRCFQFDIATQAFRRLNDNASILAIQKMTTIEEKQLLYGYICTFLGEFDRAQDFFLASSKPEAALEMRRDLLHWDTAMQLARSMRPHEVPLISREYAFELECMGDCVNALVYYEKGIERNKQPEKHEVFSELEEEANNLIHGDSDGTGYDGSNTWDEHLDICDAGIVRNVLRLGDFKRGFTMALKSSNQSLKRESASILEDAKQWSEAVELYESAGDLQAAISVCLKSNNYRKAEELFSRTKASPRLYLEFAKAKEAIGAYSDAVSAYELAKDWESAVRLLLERQNDVKSAMRIAKESGSTEAAKLVALYFTKTGDFPSAIQFLVLSKCNSAAYELALKHRKMSVYANAIGRNATTDEYKNIAIHFECARNFFMAGKFYLYAKMFTKAVRNLLRVPQVSAGDGGAEAEAALELAIEAAGVAKDRRLTQTLLTHLTGEADGSIRRPKLLFRAHMALHQPHEAALAALAVARDEIATAACKEGGGNYRRARDVLLAMTMELRYNGIKVPTEMLDNLALLHFYILAKLHIKLGNHMLAAKLLMRIVQNISKFPMHIVSILSSAVIECHRAGLRHTAFTYATTLLRAEYREEVDARYRRRFEGLVRHRERLAPPEAEVLSASAPCPFCSTSIPQYEFTCPNCRNYVPYCALTGKHIVKDDAALCPRCGFPMTYSELMSFLEKHPNEGCTMCNEPIEMSQIQRLEDAVEVLRHWNAGVVVDSETEPQASTSRPEETNEKTTDDVYSIEMNTSMQH